MQTIILVAQTLALILAGWGFWLVIVALIVRINPFQKSEEIRADAHTEYADRVVPLMHEELPNMHAIDDPRERVAAVKKIIGQDLRRSAGGAVDGHRRRLGLRVFVQWTALALRGYHPLNAGAGGGLEAGPCVDGRAGPQDFPARTNHPACAQHG